MERDRRIAVIGGGVTGITTAVMLHGAGHPTELYTEATPSDLADDRPPAFASVHAAASIHPHSVASPHSLRWTETSQEFFAALAALPGTSVRRQRHYELFEEVAAPPSYANSVRDFEFLDDCDVRRRGAPRRADAESVSGWSFSALFCEVPPYLRFLYALYAALGGKLTHVRLGGQDEVRLPRGHDVYVMCAGQASISLLAEVSSSGRYADAPLAGVYVPAADPYALKLIRGHYLMVNLAEEMRDRDGLQFAYNYTPTADLYPTEAEVPADVYCYPRSTGWLLGGSRQAGIIDDHGRWAGETSCTEEIAFPSGAGMLSVPAPIFSLNRELLDGRVDLNALRRHITAGVGLRFVRDNDHDNVRVETSRILEGTSVKIVIHNYGHGGAGYSLSWGCAMDVLDAVDRSMARSSPPAVMDTHLDAAQQALASTRDRVRDTRPGSHDQA